MLILRITLRTSLRLYGRYVWGTVVGLDLRLMLCMGVDLLVDFLILLQVTPRFRHFLLVQIFMER